MAYIIHEPYKTALTIQKFILIFYGTHTEATTLNAYGKFVTNLDLIKDDSSLVIYDMEFGDEECTTCDMDG